MWNNLPSAWLLHFARIIKPCIVRRLMCNKRLRKQLTRNSAWIHQCEDLKDFQELTEYERYTMIQEEGFWYEWYNDRCFRFIPLVKSHVVSFKGPDYVDKIIVPSIGSLGIYSRNIYVCVKIELFGGKGANANLPQKMSWAPCKEAFDVIKTKKRAKTSLSRILVAALRSYGNFSLDIELLADEYYPK